MSNFKNFHFSAVLLLALYAANIEALDLPALQTAFNNFFNTLDGIVGQRPGVPQARTAYNECIQGADTYTKLKQCAQTAFEVYQNEARIVLRTYPNYLTILNLQNTFAAAILNATKDETNPNLRLIPLDGFTQLANAAASAKLELESSRPGRG